MVDDTSESQNSRSEHVPQFDEFGRNLTVREAPPPHRMSVMERYDKERTAAFGALTDAIEAVADKITDAQYKAIYDAAMAIYQLSTHNAGVRALMLDAESLNQVASVAAEAAVTAEAAERARLQAWLQSAARVMLHPLTLLRPSRCRRGSRRWSSRGARRWRRRRAVRRRRRR